MGQQKAPTYGQIANTVLPSMVFTVDALSTLAQNVDTYVQLAPRDRRTFFEEMMQNVWPDAIDWACRPQTIEFRSQWSVSRSF